MLRMKLVLCIVGWFAGIALVCVNPHHRLLATIGILLLAGFSIALIVLLAGFVWRWLSARRRAVRWVLIGGALLLVGAFVFQRLRPPGDQARIEKAITAVIINKKPFYCEREVTTGYLEQTTGAKPPFADDICRQEAETSKARSVDTSDITINGDKATAVVSLRGGSFDGSRLVLRLLEEEGNWKVDRLSAFRHFDRDMFDRAYRRTFLEFGSPVRGANCAGRRSRRLTNAEIERAALTGGIRRTFMPIAVSCDRDGVERSLVSSVAEPNLGLPSRAIQCAAEKTKALSEAELVRVELDPVIYGELLFSCGRKAIFAYQRRELRVRESLDAAEAECVLSAFRSRPTPAAIRLSYDEHRYSALIAACRG